MSRGTAAHCIRRVVGGKEKRERDRGERRMIFYLFILSSDIVILIILYFLSRLSLPRTQTQADLHSLLLNSEASCPQTYSHRCTHMQMFSVSLSLLLFPRTTYTQGGSVEDERSKVQACFRACKNVIASCTLIYTNECLDILPLSLSRLRSDGIGIM